MTKIIRKAGATNDAPECTEAFETEICARLNTHQHSRPAAAVRNTVPGMVTVDVSLKAPVHERVLLDLECHRRSFQISCGIHSRIWNQPTSGKLLE